MLRAISIAYYALLAAFLAWYLRRLDIAVLGGLRPDFAWLATATLLGLTYRAWGVYVWREMLRGLGTRPRAPAGELAHIYAKAWLGRYVPGKVTWILGKVWFGATLGIPKERLAVGAMIEALQQVGVTLLLALALLVVDKRLSVLSSLQVVTLVAVVIAIAMLLHPRVFNALIRFARRVAHSAADVPATEVRGSTLARGSVLQAVAFLITGTSYFFLARALYPTLDWSYYLFVVGTFNLAGAVGILAVFAPSGLGVREGVQLILLPLAMPAEIALVLTVGARLWSVTVDVAFFLMAAVFRRVNGATATSVREE